MKALKKVGILILLVAVMVFSAGCISFGHKQEGNETQTQPTTTPVRVVSTYNEPSIISSVGGSADGQIVVVLNRPVKSFVIRSITPSDPSITIKQKGIQIQGNKVVINVKISATKNIDKHEGVVINAIADGQPVTATATVQLVIRIPRFGYFKPEVAEINFQKRDNGVFATAVFKFVPFDRNKYVVMDGVKVAVENADWVKATTSVDKLKNTVYVKFNVVGKPPSQFGVLTLDIKAPVSLSSSVPFEKNVTARVMLPYSFDSNAWNSLQNGSAVTNTTMSVTSLITPIGGYVGKVDGYRAYVAFVKLNESYSYGVDEDYLASAYGNDAWVDVDDGEGATLTFFDYVDYDPETGKLKFVENAPSKIFTGLIENSSVGFIIVITKNDLTSLPVKFKVLDNGDVVKEVNISIPVDGFKEVEGLPLPSPYDLGKMPDYATYSQVFRNVYAPSLTSTFMSFFVAIFSGMSGDSIGAGTRANMSIITLANEKSSVSYKVLFADGDTAVATGKSVGLIVDPYGHVKYLYYGVVSKSVSEPPRGDLPTVILTYSNGNYVTATKVMLSFGDFSLPSAYLGNQKTGFFADVIEYVYAIAGGFGEGRKAVRVKPGIFRVSERGGDLGTTGNITYASLVKVSPASTFDAEIDTSFSLENSSVLIDRPFNRKYILYLFGGNETSGYAPVFGITLPLMRKASELGANDVIVSEVQKGGKDYVSVINPTTSEVDVDNGGSKVKIPPLSVGLIDPMGDVKVIFDGRTVAELKPSDISLIKVNFTEDELREMFNEADESGSGNAEKLFNYTASEGSLYYSVELSTPECSYIKPISKITVTYEVNGKEITVDVKDGNDGSWLDFFKTYGLLPPVTMTYGQSNFDELFQEIMQNAKNLTPSVWFYANVYGKGIVHITLVPIVDLAKKGVSVTPNDKVLLRKITITYADGTSSEITLSQSDEATLELYEFDTPFTGEANLIFTLGVADAFNRALSG